MFKYFLRVSLPLFVVLIVFSTFLSEKRLSAETPDPITLKWTYYSSVLNIEFKSIVPAELNDDAKKELIVVRNSAFENGQYFTEVSALSSTGSLIWKKQLPSTSEAVAIITAGNIDNDKYQEIIVRDNARIYAIDQNGTIMPGWPKQYFRACMESGVMLADINNDNKDEIIVSSFDGPTSNLRAFNYQGILLWTRTLEIDLTGNVVTNNAYGDIDNDGLYEIVTGFQVYGSGPGVSSIIFITNENNGTNYNRFNVFNDRITSSPVLADFDGDKELEILGLYQRWADNQVTNWVINAFEDDGTSVPGWPVVLDNQSLGSSELAVADLNNDKVPEVVLVDKIGQIHAWSNDGAILPGWPIVNPYVSNQDYRSYPLIVDIDGDNLNEVVLAGIRAAVGSNISYIYAYNDDGSSVAGFPRYVLYSRPSQLITDMGVVVLGDVKTPQLFIALSVDQTASRLLFYNINISESIMSSYLTSWPMFQRDPSRSGKYSRYIELQSPVDNEVVSVPPIVTWRKDSLAVKYRVTLQGGPVPGSIDWKSMPTSNNSLQIPSFGFKTGYKYSWGVLPCWNSDCTMYSGVGEKYGFYWQSSPI